MDHLGQGQVQGSVRVEAMEEDDTRVGKGCKAGPENAEGSTFICINKNRKGSRFHLAKYLSCALSL